MSHLAPHNTPAQIRERYLASRPPIAHLVPRRGLTRAYVQGLTITALCGHRFVPTRDPAGRPICRGCREIKALYDAEQS